MCFAFLTFEKKFHVAGARECAEGHVGISACVEALLSGHIPFPWMPGTVGKPPWDLPGTSSDCGSQRLLASLQLQVGGVPWNHMMFGLKGHAKECSSHPALTSDF